MKIVGKNVSKDEADAVVRLVRRCMTLLSKKEYELNLPKGATNAAIAHLEVKNRKNTPSRAGRNLIRINLGYWQIHNKVHTEYKAYNHNPIIGQVECSEPFDHLMVMVAHEVAHYIQYTYAPDIPRYRHRYKKPHGDVFRSIYTYLRRDLVNPIINAKVKEKKNARDQI